METTSAKIAPRCLSHPFQAPQKCRKPEKTAGFSMFFTLQPWCQSRPKMLPETSPEAPKLTPKWQSCRYHGSSYSYLAPSRSQLTANFAQASPILRPSSPQLRLKFPPNRAMYPKKCPKSAQDISGLQFTSIFDPFRTPFSEGFAQKAHNEDCKRLDNPKESIT